MNNNRVVLFAVIFAVVSLISSTIVGFFSLHSHDDFLKRGANNLTKTQPYWNDDGTITWNNTVYDKIVPFEQGMTLMPRQSATMSVEWVFDTTTTVAHEMTPEEYRAWLLSETTTTIK